jgi:protocatechuate 3,4-dioxygenase beta subunit
VAQHRWPALIGASFLAFVASASAQTPRDGQVGGAPVGTATIRGRMTITTPTGVLPVRRARIALEGGALRAPALTDTDTDGNYHFDHLAAGRYRVSGDKAGFTPQLTDPRRAFQKPAPFDVGNGQLVVHDLAMQRGAAVSGTLRRANGEPAINVVVSAVRTAYSELGRTPVAVRSARTNDLGQFRIHSLPPGDYRVDAAPDPLEAANQIRTPGPRLPELARTYFPGSPRLQDARVVSVAAAQDLGSIDFTMTTMAVGSLSGGVMNAQGQPAVGAGLRIQRVGGPVGEVRGFSSVQDNTFNYSLVPPGDYWLMAVARPQPGGVMEFGVVKYHAEGLEVKGFQISTEPGVAVTGRVEIDGATVPNGTRIVAVETAYQLPGAPGQPANGWTAAVAPDGTFGFDALFGPRLFRVQGLPDNLALTSVWSGDRNITDVPINIRPAAAMAPLRVRLTAATGTLDGVARDSRGAPVARARIVIFGDDLRAWGPWSRVVKTAEAGEDGRYEIRGILPGSYSVAATGFLDDMAWFDADVLTQLKTNARPMVVPGPGKITVDPVVR